MRGVCGRPPSRCRAKTRRSAFWKPSPEPLPRSASRSTAKRQPLYRDAVPLERRIDRFPVILEDSDEPSDKISSLVFSRVLEAIRGQRLLAATVLFDEAPVRRGRFLRPLGLAARPAGFALIAIDEENRPVRVELSRLESVRLLPSYLPLPDRVESDLERALAAAVPL